MTEAQLKQYIIDNLPDNVAKEITPAILRDVLDNMVEVMFPGAGDALPVWDSTINAAEGSFYFFNGTIWECVQKNGPDLGGAVEPGTDPAFWVEADVFALAHAQNTDYKLKWFPVSVSQAGGTIDVSSGASYSNINAIYLSPPSAGLTYSIRMFALLSPLADQIVDIVVPITETHSATFVTDDNQDIPGGQITLNPGDWARFKWQGNNGLKCTVIGMSRLRNSEIEFIRTGSESNQNLSSDTVFIESSEAYLYNLQEGALVSGKEVTVRKTSSATHQLNIEARSGEFLLINDTASAGIQTSVQGAWIKLKAYDDGISQGWTVVMSSGDWAGYV